ncbi:MAG: hypothetical protein V8T25_01180 [Sutterella wadsworthensis]
MKIAKAFDTNGFKVSPDFSFAVVPTVGDREIDSNVRFAGAESTYNFPLKAMEVRSCAE